MDARAPDPVPCHLSLRSTAAIEQGARAHQSEAAGDQQGRRTHVVPPTATEEREVGAFTAESGFEHAATVEEENPIFPVGSELRDRELYFTNVSPTLEGTYTYSFATTTGDSVTVETELALRTRAVDDDMEYWSERRTLGTDRVEAPNGSETVEVPFAVDVPTVEQRVDEVERGLGGSPGSTETAIVARTTFTGTIADERIEETEEHLLAIQPSGTIYRVDSEGGGETRTAVTEPATATHHFGPIRSYGSPLLLFLSAGLFGAIGGLRYRGTLRPSSEIGDAIRVTRTRRALDDWITVGRVPTSYERETVIAVDSLSGLVDVAIDSDRRVIEDDECDRYFVVLDDWIYVYSPLEDRDGPGDDSSEATVANEEVENTAVDVESNGAELSQNRND